MEYNRVKLSTFFYVLVWRHFVAWRTRLFERIADGEYDHQRARIDKLIRSKPTPPKLSAWYRKNYIEYIPERIDNIKTPESFLQDGGGDCDDFVEFALEVLVPGGYRCRRLYLSGSEPSHVVLVADRGGVYFIMDTYACYEVNTLEEALLYFVDDGLDEFLLI